MEDWLCKCKVPPKREEAFVFSMHFCTLGSSTGLELCQHLEASVGVLSPGTVEPWSLIFGILRTFFVIGAFSSNDRLSRWPVCKVSHKKAKIITEVSSNCKYSSFVQMASNENSCDKLNSLDQSEAGL